MFERYSESARRALFFARYEVAQTGGMTIEPEHLVLGVLRDNWKAVLKSARAAETADTIRARLESAPTAKRVSTSVEIPFSVPCKEALERAALEADDLKNTTIWPEHIVLGVMAKADGVAARALRDAGVDPDALRESLRDRPNEAADQTSGSPRVARQWKGIVKAGAAVSYIAHLQHETFPSLRRISGFVIAFAVHREVEDGTEFQVTTYWRSLDAIKAFAGDDITRAVVPPAAQSLMVRYDDRAVHYDIVPELE